MLGSLIGKSAGHFRRFTSGSALVFVFLFTASGAFAQDDPPENLAPPPVKSLTKDESTQLAAQSDVKEYIKVALVLMDARLKKAESLTSETSYAALLSELGGFQAIMANSMTFLNRNNTGRGKVLDTMRKFEIALRGYTPRIEVIRRELPDRYEYHVRRLLRDVRDTRAKAVEPMFADTVVPALVNKNNR